MMNGIVELIMSIMMMATNPVALNNAAEDRGDWNTYGVIMYDTTDRIKTSEGYAYHCIAVSENWWWIYYGTDGGSEYYIPSLNKVYRRKVKIENNFNSSLVFEQEMNYNVLIAKALPYKLMTSFVGA